MNIWLFNRTVFFIFWNRNRYMEPVPKKSKSSIPWFLDIRLYKKKWHHRIHMHSCIIWFRYDFNIVVVHYFWSFCHWVFLRYFCAVYRFLTLPETSAPAVYFSPSAYLPTWIYIRMYKPAAIIVLRSFSYPFQFI